MSKTLIKVNQVLKAQHRLKKHRNDKEFALFVVKEIKNQEKIAVLQLFKNTFSDKWRLRETNEYNILPNGTLGDNWSVIDDCANCYFTIKSLM